MTTEAVERRIGPDRRERRVSLRFPERRSGFDRREPLGRPASIAWQRMVRRYGSRPRLVAAVAAAIVAANAADLLLTMRALGMGAVELNPVMAALIGASPVAAAAFKLVVAAAVAGGIWALRRYRRALEVSLALLGLMGVLLVYHAVLAAAAAG